VVLLSAAAAATLHRRHLMVWQAVLATSAPKRTFDMRGIFHCECMTKEKVKRSN
jgi:hypothetical protein